MSTPAEATRVRHEVVVEAAIERAFSVFTDDFGAFKPREHNMLAVDIAETIFEPHAGGHLYDRGVDGSECRWARVLAYEAPDRVVISWDITPQWQIETDPGKTSEVEVRFITETPSARAWCLSTATSTATSTVGRPSERASTPRAAGRSTCAATPTCSPPEGAFDANERK